MPNTLIHIAVQAPLSRAIYRRAEIPWILVGAIIPDIPWIFQRIFLSNSFADPYQTRLYFTAQASLLFCMLLSITVSSFSRQPGRTFSLLALNCFMHLVLDALQIKWGNGVHLLAPFSWQSTNLGLVWPEHLFGYLASMAGAAYLIWKLPSIQDEGLSLCPRPKWPFTLISVLLYFTLPLIFMNQLQAADPSYTHTLLQKDNRTGKPIELDRSYYSKSKNSVTLFTGEQLNVFGALPEESGTISLQGRFVSKNRVHSTGYHMHNHYRDYASKLGLALALFIWVYILTQKLLRLRRSRIK